MSVISDNDKPSTEIINTKIFKHYNEKSKISNEGGLKLILSVTDDVIERIESKLEVFKEIFLSYAKLGDKLNLNKMNYTGFLRFLKDCDLIHQNKNNFNKSSNDYFTTRKSFSPVRSVLSSPMTASMKNTKRSATSYLIKGKIIESEAFCVFCSLTGYQNFDNSVKIRTQFDQNKGFTHKIGETIKNTTMFKSNSLASNKTNVPMKMDFNLFIKSFEVISKKIYIDKTLNEAVLFFIENVIFLIIF